jgi:hypothetical protein
MGMNGFCILDSDFTIHSYNHHFLNLLEIEPGKTVESTIMRIFKDNHPLYNQKSTQFAGNSYGNTG